MLLYDFSVTVSHCPRACNSVAHALAAMGLYCESDPLIWHESVSVLLSRELPGQRVVNGSMISLKNLLLPS